MEEGGGMVEQRQGEGIFEQGRVICEVDQDKEGWDWLQQPELNCNLHPKQAYMGYLDLH